MLGVMYTINKVPRSRSGVPLTCNECSHTLRVNEFEDTLGSCRTQPACPCWNMLATTTATSR
jgi:hypothetical protein